MPMRQIRAPNNGSRINNFTHAIVVPAGCRLDMQQHLAVSNPGLDRLVIGQQGIFILRIST
jgi:hypothetical protein